MTGKFCHCADRIEMGLQGPLPFEENPKDGVCCKCGYTEEEETECPHGDGTHCVHWWDGPSQSED